jgi:hypothetical protein
MAKGEVAQISLVLSNFPRFDFNGSKMVWGRCFVRGPAMDTRHSYYLHRRQDDFAELAADTSRLDFNDIPFIVPANDNLRTKEKFVGRLWESASSVNHASRSLVGIDLDRAMSFDTGVRKN